MDSGAHHIHGPQDLPNDTKHYETIKNYEFVGAKNPATESAAYKRNEKAFYGEDGEEFEMPDPRKERAKQAKMPQQISPIKPAPKPLGISQSAGQIANEPVNDPDFEYAKKQFLGQDIDEQTQFNKDWHAFN